MKTMFLVSLGLLIEAVDAHEAYTIATSPGTGDKIRLKSISVYDDEPSYPRATAVPAPEGIPEPEPVANPGPDRMDDATLGAMLGENEEEEAVADVDIFATPVADPPIPAAVALMEAEGNDEVPSDMPYIKTLANAGVTSLSEVIELAENQDLDSVNKIGSKAAVRITEWLQQTGRMGAVHQTAPPVLETRVVTIETPVEVAPPAVATEVPDVRIVRKKLGHLAQKTTLGHLSKVLKHFGAESITTLAPENYQKAINMADALIENHGKK